jgi:hypothetical protein
MTGNNTRSIEKRNIWFGAAFALIDLLLQPVSALIASLGLHQPPILKPQNAQPLLGASCWIDKYVLHCCEALLDLCEPPNSSNQDSGVT